MLSCSLAASAQEYVAPTPAPLVYAPLAWKNDDKITPGFWYTADQVVKIDARINYLENRCAQDCIEQTKSGLLSLPAWLFIASGIVVGGLGGYFIAHH